MARIVLTCWGSHGDVDPFLALARGLGARGHAPVVAAPEFYRDVVTAAGVGFHPVRPAVDPNDGDLLRRVMDPVRGSEVVLRELVMTSVEDAYADLDAVLPGADLLVSHPVTVAAPVAAERRGLRWASVVLAPLAFWSAYDMPVMPPAPWLKRADRLGPWANRLLMRAIRRATRTWSDPVYALRSRLGLSRGGDPIYEGQHSPRLILGAFTPLLAPPQPDWPAQLLVTGQLLYDAPHGAALAPELAAFLDAGAPPVVFTLGTSAVLAPGDFYAESAAAVRALGRRAVLLVGRDREAEYARLAGDDVLVAGAAPHSLLLPRAAGVVQQCGAGTLGQTLRAGHPTLAVPFAHDQPDNAHRAARLGVARVVPAGRYRAARAADELRRLLEEPSYAARAADVGRRVRAEDGVGVACDALERVLG